MKAMGDTYALKNTVNNPSDIEIQTITTDGTVSTKKHPISNKVKYQIVSIMSADKTSRDDLAESGTH